MKINKEFQYSLKQFTFTLLKINFDSIFKKHIFYCLQKSSDPILKEVYEKMIKPNTKTLPISFEQGLRRVCEERKFGFLIAQRTFHGLGQNISCKIVDIPIACYTSEVALILSRGSPYKRLFTRL
jgi:hypothetical protein